MICKQSLLIFLLVALIQFAHSSDLQNDRTKYFTGNPGVDLFSGSVKLPNDNSMFENFQDGISTESVSKKSPLLAGGMSLLVPGAGEIYNAHYIKAGIFIAVEAASWIYSIHYNKKGDDQTKLFQDYVNERVNESIIDKSDRYQTRWDVIRYYEWSDRHKLEINPNGKYESLQNAIVSNDKTLPPWERIDWERLNALERAIGNRYSHTLPRWGEQQYYELIGKYVQFNQGWDDAPENYIYGQPVSQRLKYYAKISAIAEDRYRKANTALMVIIANHVISALDAYFSARAINSKLCAEFRMENRETPFGEIPVVYATIKIKF